MPDCGCECPSRPSMPAPQPDCIVVIERECDCGCDKPEEDDCGCRPSKNDPVSGMPLAMAYVPWQDFKEIYSEDESWCNGTIFAQLDLEFMCRRCN